jgi:magnesium-transporting ATPase (P-type)
MMVPECRVRRSGKVVTALTRELVPGDVVLLEGGDRVPADLRIFEAYNLFVDEAALTGESVPVQKDTAVPAGDNLAPGQQTCMLFSGTFVTRGRAEGVVMGTASRTEIGKIAGMMQGTKKVEPPIMKKIADFTKAIIYVCVGFGVLAFLMGMFVTSRDWSYMLLASLSVIVAMVPEGLAGAIIAAFAIGATMMARRNALVKRLPAVETLGCTTVICSDKTGTLTRNEMTVVRIYAGGRDYEVSGAGYQPRGEFSREGNKIDLAALEGRDLSRALQAGGLCNTCELTETEKGWAIKGDPTEGALVVAAAKAGITRDRKPLDEIPFDPELRYMATLHEDREKHLVYVKGSPERILEMCSSQLVDGHEVPLRKEEIMGKVTEMARSALRVLAVAGKETGTDTRKLEHQGLGDMVFLGLQGMIDPPRSEAIEAVGRCKRAGIRVVMITGDHAETARAVAAQLGIGEGEARAVTGQELAAMSDDQLQETVKQYSVYARVAPEHKFKIVDKLQKLKNVVAVTGDGVNDAPALKRADIGIAMGINGTEVSKEAADMVLTDDNFASIVAAVEEGRNVFTNIWKVILYLLPTNGGQGLVMVGAVLLSPFIAVFAKALPLEPVMILWVNLIIAIACSIPLIWEPKEKGILDRPPRDPNQRLFNKLFMQKVGLVSLVSTGVTFGVFINYMNTMSYRPDYVAEAQTAAFTALILVQVAYLFTARSIRESVFKFSFFSNRWVIIGAAATVLLQVLLVYFQPLFGVSPFRTLPFAPEWWLPIVGLSLLGLVTVEIEKVLRRRYEKAAPGGI